MIKRGLAGLIVKKDAKHFTLVWFILFFVALLSLAMTALFSNYNGYLTMSKGMANKDLYYFCSSPTSRESEAAARNYLKENNDNFGIYSNNRKLFISDSGYISIGTMSNNLWDCIEFKTDKGLKNFAGKKGGIASSNSGLKKGDVITVRGADDIAIEVEILGVLSDDNMFLKLSVSGTDMDISYLYGTLNAQKDYPLVMIPAEKYGLDSTKFLDGGFFQNMILDFSGCTDGAKDFHLNNLSKYGDLMSIDDMREKNKDIRNGILYLATPFIVVGWIFVIMLLTVVLEYSIKRNNRTIAILQSVGWQDSDILSVFMWIAARIVLTILAVLIPIVVAASFLLGSMSIVFKLWALILVLLLFAAITMLSTFIVCKTRIAKQNYEKERVI